MTIVISIHAPARGATTLGYSFRCYRSDFNPRSREGSDRFADISTFGPSNFNPRSREGSDVIHASRAMTSSQFQSTLPRGERRIDRMVCRIRVHNFNPRSREGSDCIY